MVESLLCEATTCAYNASKQCTAPAINIVGGTTKKGRDTSCATFTEDKDQASPNTTNFVMSTASTNNQFTADTQVAYNSAPVVGCNATNCTYNDSNICYAVGVKILGQKEAKKGSTECYTFRPE